MYEGLPVSQVIALVANQSLARVWTIVGMSVLETAERNEPTFQAVIASFEILTNPSPAYVGPVGPSRPRRLRGVGRPPRYLGPHRRRHELIAFLRTLRDEGRSPGQFETPPEGVEAFEGTVGSSEDRPKPASDAPLPQPALCGTPKREPLFLPRSSSNRYA